MQAAMKTLLIIGAALLCGIGALPTTKTEVHKVYAVAASTSTEQGMPDPLQMDMYHRPQQDGPAAEIVQAETEASSISWEERQPKEQDSVAELEATEEKEEEDAVTTETPLSVQNDEAAELPSTTENAVSEEKIVLLADEPVKVKEYCRTASHSIIEAEADKKA